MLFVCHPVFKNLLPLPLAGASPSAEEERGYWSPKSYADEPMLLTVDQPPEEDRYLRPKSVNQPTQALGSVGGPRARSLVNS